MRHGFRTAASSLLAGLALTALFVPAGDAAAAGDVTVALQASRVVAAANGKERLEPTESVRPGELIEYRATYTNRGAGAVRGLEGVLPIPVGTEYVGLSATPAGVEASTDGVRFAPIPLMRKVVRDGRETWEPVPASEYRALRWKLGELAPDAKASIAARVLVPQTRVAGR
jgi:hypothetical protein